MPTLEKEKCRHAPHGFTLIELLVVISIISLLIALLLPSLSRAKAQAYRAVCGTKIKALGTALAEYLSEWNATLPINGLVLPKSGVPTMYLNDQRFMNAEAPPEKWRLEFGALWSYMGGKSPDPGVQLPLPATMENLARNYICPVDDLERTGGGSAADATAPLTLPIPPNGSNPIVLQGAGSPGYWSYSVNSVCNSLGRFRNRFATGGLPWHDPIRQIDIKGGGSNFIVFVEEDKSSLFNDEVFDAPAYSDGDQLTNRHSGGGNVGFFDSHVEFFNQTIFDQVPSGIAGGTVSHGEAMTSPYTRMFFPDGGEFANGLP